jgi:hypothetical protein
VPARPQGRGRAAPGRHRVARTRPAGIEGPRGVGERHLSCPRMSGVSFRANAARRCRPACKFGSGALSITRWGSVALNSGL